MIIKGTKAKVITMCFNFCLTFMGPARGMVSMK